MSESTVAVSAAESSTAGAISRTLYRAFGYFGLFSIFGVLAFGFRFGAEAVPANYGWNAALYGLFIVPHLIMTRSWFKKAVWGNPAGAPTERRVYITITVVTWLAVLWLHRPVPGPALAAPTWVTFIGFTLFMICAYRFFEGVSMKMIDGLLGVPGSVSAYSHGSETPLFTEGPYAQVRHPMYRAAILAGLASLIIHPHIAQVFWAGLIGGTFIVFIPIEEAQMIRARGEDYHEYRRQTRWRLLRGIW